MCQIRDCDPWKVYRASTRIARKEHECFECSRTISGGERYHYATGLHSDSSSGWDTFKLCAHCDAASQWLIVVCGGFLYGGIGEELRDHWNEDYGFRSRGLGQLIHGRERHWRKPRWRGGGLMEVPAYAEAVAEETMRPILDAERAALTRKVEQEQVTLDAALAAGDEYGAETVRRRLMRLGYAVDTMAARDQAEAS